MAGRARGAVLVLALLVGVVAPTVGTAVTDDGGCGITITPWSPPDPDAAPTRLLHAGDRAWGLAADGRVLAVDGDGRPRTGVGDDAVLDGFPGASGGVGTPDGGVLLVRTSTDDAPRVELLRLDRHGAPHPGHGDAGRVVVPLPADPAGHVAGLARTPAGDVLVTTRAGGDVVVARLRADGTRVTAFGDDGLATFDAAGAEPRQATLLPSGRVVVVGQAGSSGFGSGPGVAWVREPDGTPAVDVGDAGRVDLDGPVGTAALEARTERLVSFADATPGAGTAGRIDLATGAVSTSDHRLATPGAARWVDDGWVVASTEGLGGFGDEVLVATRRDDRGRPVGAWGDERGTTRVDLAARIRLDAAPVGAVRDDGGVDAVSVGVDWDGTPVLVHVRLDADGHLTAAHEWCPDDDRPADPDVRRVAGATRYATAVALSQAGYPDGADHVVVATGTSFPDALAGGPAAAALGAPVLLVEPDAVPPEVATELRRLGPSAVTLLGGPAALSPAVAESVATLTRTTPRRLAGPDRVATAAAISRATFAPGVPVAFVTTGENFPDALATGAVAGTLGGPVLLTTAAGVPDATRAELDRLAPTTVVVVGGPVAVGPTPDQLADTFDVEVVAGPDRYATARAVVTRFRDEPDGHRGRPVTTMFLATGENFPDALAGAALAATAGGVVALVPPGTVDERLRDVVGRLHPRTLWVLGGPAAVGDVWPDALRRPGATSFTYIADPLAPEHPLRWDPCAPIHWVFNDDGAPVGGRALVAEAFQRLGAETGWSFVADGLTDEPLAPTRSPYQPDRYGDRWAPVLVGWGVPAAGAVAGQAGPTWVADVHVSGQLVLNRDLSLPMTFDEGGWGDIVLHELGHVLGLDHPGDPTQTMYWRVVSGVSGLQDGDVAGLTRLREGGCLPVPTPSRVPGRATTRVIVD